NNEAKAEAVRLRGVPWNSFTLLPGHRVLSGTRSGHLEYYEFASAAKSVKGKTPEIRPQMTWPAHSGFIWATALSPDPEHRYVLTVGQDPIIRIWAPQRPQPLLSLFLL